MNEITYKPIEEKYALEVAKLLKLCFPLMPPDDQYSAGELRELAKIFPEGTIIALDGKKVIGMGTGIFTNMDLDKLPPTEDDILYAPDGRNLHDWNGRYYFGSDMAVHPDYRGRSIGREIYNRRKAVIKRYNKKGFVAAAVLPGYAQHEATLDIDSYLAKVVAGELYDPTLSMQLRNGFQVIRPIHEFFNYPRSGNWSALIYWPNPDYIEIVTIRPEFAPALEELQRACFPTLGEQELMKEKHFLKHCEIFPEGEFVALANGRVVGLGSGFFYNFDFNDPRHTFHEIIAGGYYTNHDPDGEYYYGADISVHPDYRGRGIGRLLYDARKELVIHANRKGIVAGGVLPGYPKHRGQLTIPEYVDKVVAGDLFDPTLTMQLRNGFEVKGLLKNYIDDSNSDNWATLIVWQNPHYKETTT